MTITQPRLKIVTALVIDGRGVRLCSPLTDINALALLRGAAEDVVDWEDVALVWSRYQFDPETTEFADGLPILETDLESALELLGQADAWFTLDLVHKRLFTGDGYPRLRCHRTPAAGDHTARTEAVPEDAKAEVVVLPPWWELHQQCDPIEISHRRSAPIVIPHARREVLWGTAMTRFFAQAMLTAIRAGQPWIAEDRRGPHCGSHERTIEIHRDWLMTPRDDLNGRIPRECLHGGRDWIGDLADSQRFRVAQDEDPIPITSELSTYESAPMGPHEMVLYFDACRETINAGWLWLIDNNYRIDDPSTEGMLGLAMDAALANWLQLSFEGGQPPAEIIRCDRVRVPLVDTAGDHVVDCDCPICDMMVSGMLGPSFVHYDGHHLELDDEFAFSMCATREEWQLDQCDWELIGAETEDEIGLESETASCGSAIADFSPTWRDTFLSEEGIPGDTYGHLALAFLLADVVSSLQDKEAQSDIEDVNDAFREYRTAMLPSEIADAADIFKQTLEAVAGKYVTLVSRCADLQSRIDAQVRSGLLGDDVPL